MARLILLNGAPGSGKSTLARRFAEQHPLTLVLDVDLVRGMLGGWLDQPMQSGTLARRLASAMVRTHLAEGLDVIVPQYLGRLEFVRMLQQLCHDADARFIEGALVSSKADAVRRFEQRSATSTCPEHREAAELQRRAGGVEELQAMYDRLLEVIAARPATHLIDTVEGETDRAYNDLLAVLAN